MPLPDVGEFRGELGDCCELWWFLCWVVIVVAPDGLKVLPQGEGGSLAGWSVESMGRFGVPGKLLDAPA